MQNIDPDWEITVQDVKARMDKDEDFFFLDVRQSEEYEHCRIDGTTLVPLPELQSRLEEIGRLAAGREIIAHCHHGHRSMQAAVLLRQAGLGTARSMAGGIDAWSIQIDRAVPRY
ncbi:MAG: hypothetical protein MI923_11710 [Phycisphaerales bacterium]|nr:hypothetical protein [Phycisphaerales bacterium]